MADKGLPEPLAVPGRTRNREERFLERQRGAGAREISLAFDLDLPGIPRVSKTPLKPQKSGRSKKTPQSDPPLTRSTHKTPKSTKIAPTLSSRRTPAIARQRATKAKATVQSTPDVGDPDTTQATQAVQDTNGTPSTHKRKALDEIQETESVNPPKKKRKRKSIGQQSSKRKPRVPLKSRDPKKLPNPILPVQGAPEPQLKNPALTPGHSGETPKEVSTLTDEKQDLAGIENEKTVVQPRRRTRKSGPRKKPVATQSEVHGKEMVEHAEVHEPPKVESQSETMPVGNEARLKPRKRKRKAIAQSPKKRSKPSLNQPPLVLNNAADKPVVTPHEHAQEPVPPAAAIETKGSKRGRKPRLVSNEQKELSEVLTDAAPEFLRAEATPADFSESGTKPNQTTNSPVAPKRRGRKRKSVGQAQKPKHTANIHQVSETMRSDPQAIDAPLTVTIPPVAADRGGENEVSVSLGVTENPGSVSIPGQPQPAEAPTKRGRAKKPAAPIGQTDKSTVESLPDEPQQIERPQKRGGSRKPAAHLEGIGQLIPEATPDEPRPEDVPKKRGRPKKPTSSSKEVEILTIHSSPTKPQPVEAPRNRGRQKKPTSSSKEVEVLTIESNPTKPQPVEAPKKRGRPSKATLAEDAAELNGAEKIPTEDVKFEKPFAKPSPPTKAFTEPSTDPPPFVTGAYAPTALVQPAQQPLLIARKRGRPKKQLPALAIADTASEEAPIAQEPVLESSRPNRKNRAQDVSDLHIERVPRGKFPTARTRPSDHDSFSDAIPIAPKKRKPSAQPNNILAKRTQPINEPEPFSETQLDHPKPTTKAKRRGRSTQKPTRQPPHTAALSPAPEPSDFPAIDPPANHAPAPHNHPPLPEKHGRNQPLPTTSASPSAEPQTQQEQQHEPQKVSQQQHHHHLPPPPPSASSAQNHRRKMNALDFENAAAAAAKPHRKGLEGFVFSRVGRKKKKQGMKEQEEEGGKEEEEEAIHPELQELLSRVRGLGASGNGKEETKEEGGGGVVVRIC
ncbi:MAG: hypothetical protein LQ345_005927 [Seirophora villosa]|nr:MAG: hypothetical protein LQ345_005927 [Seirophora villosa]